MGLLLYLLARCVKGAVRYNTEGLFNQSPDKRRLGTRPETMKSNIAAISALLRGKAIVTSLGYEDVLANVRGDDVVYMDPPYQGVCGERDSRYFAGISYDDFVSELEMLNHKYIRYLVSYDGRLGNRAYGKPLPAKLNLTLMEVEAGRSSQATLLERDEITVESLYLSPALADQLEAHPGSRTTIVENDADFCFSHQTKFWQSCGMAKQKEKISIKSQAMILREDSTPYRVNGNTAARARVAPPPVSRLVEKKKLIPFGWYGGKFSHLNWLLPLLPPCHHYCEPFAGSGAVLLNREPSPVETFNDIDGEVVNFFRVLREEKEGLIEAIGLTPFSREEFAIACEVSPDLAPLERARRFYVRARQVRIGLAQTATIGRWANCKNTSRAGMSGVISRWLGAVEDLPAVAERLLRVQIENRPAIEVIRLYDSPTTLFYCDPPYVHSTRGDSKAYGYEMTDTQHCGLAEVLNSVQGMVALSNYPSEFLDKLYPAPKWHKTVTAERTNHSTKDKRVEVLWTNYDPHKIKRNGKYHGELFPVA